MLHGAFALWFEAPGPRSGSGRAVMGVGGRGADSIYLSLHISLTHSPSLIMGYLLSLSLSLFLCFSVLFSLARSRISFLLLSLSFLFVCRSFFTLFLCRIRCLYRCIIFLSLSLSRLPSPHFLSLPSLSSITLALSIYLSLSTLSLSICLSLTLSFSFCILCLSFLLPSLLCLSLSLVFACPSVLPS